MSEDEDDREIETPGQLDTSHQSVIREGSLTKSKQRINRMLNRVLEELEERGIPVPIQPTGHPKALANIEINTLTNSELASLYTQYVAYSSYIGDELAQIECLEEAAKKLLRDTLAELKDAQFVKGIKGSEATSAAMQNPLYHEVDQEHAKYFFMKAIMKRRYRNYTIQAAALSRNIEIRKLDFEQQRRDNNNGLPPRKPTPSGFGPKKPAPR